MARSPDEEIKLPEWLVAILGILVFVVILAVIGGGIFRIFFIYEIDFQKIGFIYNRVNGTIEVAKHPGYKIIYPLFESGHEIDGRPFQVCINANNRVLNCKLIQFDPAGLNEFLRLHGRDFENQNTSLENIMRAYAFDGSGKKYPFLRIIQDIKAENVGDYITGNPYKSGEKYAAPITSR